MPLGKLGSHFREGPQLVVVDGYEQLSRWNRWRLRSWCRRRGCGLLVTSHAPTGLPARFCTSVSPELAMSVARKLLPPGDRTIGDDHIRRCFAEQGGNLRETLFALYTIYERRRKGPSQASTAAR
jgi:hypothetical protein